MAGPGQAFRQVTFVIPPGFGAGKATVQFPDEVVLTVGLKDTIVIENQDDRIHSFGPFVVGPRATLTKRFKTPVIYQEACTFHQSRQMRLVVKPAPWQVWLSGESAGGR